MSARRHGITPSLLQIRLWLGGKIFGPVGPRGTKVTRRTFIKGPCEPTELAAMNYVAKHTSIPIPNIIKTYKYHGALYIEMEYIPAMSLEKAWLGGHLSQAEKEHIVTELAGYVSQLRSLNPPHRELVGSADCNSCLDYRVGFSTFGPFTNHQDFHSFLRRGLAIENCTESFSQDVTDCHSRTYQSRFTHADLCPRNILVRDGKVSAIIDWEFAGWYPEYWEYTKAHYGQIEMPDWYAQLGSVMGGYGDELNAERVLWNRCDLPGMPLFGQTLVGPAERVGHKLLNIKLLSKSLLLQLFNATASPTDTILLRLESLSRKRDRLKKGSYPCVCNVLWNLPNHYPSKKMTTECRIDIISRSEKPIAFWIVVNSSERIGTGGISHVVRVASSAPGGLWGNKYAPVVCSISKSLSAISERQLIAVVYCDKDTVLVAYFYAQNCPR
ncbi:hypothetical protein FQN50_001036 [Emmonsiellopsis sp. PD_5]|nr:hypothetical protein FQN50_001036 [Emmonsiellopsis sp. PD_5]